MIEPQPGIYKHYKGTLVEVLGVTSHSETLEPLVVYKKLEAHKNYPAGSIWVRPKKMFLEKVKIKGKRVPRFSRVTAGSILKPIDIFWIGIFPFVLFMINYIFFVLAEEWVRRVYADDYLHLLGGASIAFSAGYVLSLLEKSGKLILRNKLVTLLIIMGAVALAAVVWEFYEFILDILYIPINQPSVEDTIKDLVMGLLGGTLLASIWVSRKTKNWPSKTSF